MRIKVATWNAPHRLRPHHDGLRWAKRKGADVVLCQEHTDSDNWAPSGFSRVRPRRGQSNTICYRRATMRMKRSGSKRMSSPGFRSYRDLLWVAFRTKKDGHPLRVAGIHLPAFYNTPNKRGEYPNRVEYDKQAPKVARWMRNGKNRVVGGDFNGSKGNKRMAPIEKDVRLSAAVKTGPHGQKIDYVGQRRRGGTWKIVKTERGPKFGSDHNIVLVTLEWAG